MHSKKTVKFLRKTQKEEILVVKNFNNSKNLLHTLKNTTGQVEVTSQYPLVTECKF